MTPDDRNGGTMPLRNSDLDPWSAPDCDDAWHTQRGEPTKPCPTCDAMPPLCSPEEMPPGTIVTLGGLVVRRRPYATGGLPWKSRTGARYEHFEVGAFIADGGRVTFCRLCAATQRCESHDQAAADVSGGAA